MKSIPTISLLLTCGLCFGQNLVPNWNFEQYSTCPTSLNQLSRATYWTNPGTGSPDYYNSCATNPFSDVPKNWPGYEFPRSGEAYAGIIVTNHAPHPTVNSNYREYLQTPLTDTLVGGINYFIKFFVSAGDSMNYISNNIGVYFSKVAIQDTCANCPLPYIPQFENTSILNSRSGWSVVLGTYTAMGGEKYILIGNYKDSIASVETYTGWFTTNSSKNLAYYYVDDVCISTDTSSCYTSVGIHQIKQNADVSLFPNPFFNQLTLSLADNEQTTVLLYNFLGQQVLQQTFTNSATINTEQLADGIYFYELRNDKGLVTKGKVIRQ